ncbi:MAG: HEAT repeat domain-containing protein [Thermoplasmatota archaeon]
MSENVDDSSITNFNQLLHNLMEKGDDDVRAYTVEALGTIRSDMAIDDLINSLSDKNELVRMKVTEILGDINEKNAALKIAKQGLHDDKDLVRWMSAWALGKLRAEETMEELVNSLDDENPWVRGTSAWALGRIGNDVPVKKLKNLTKDDNTYTRIQAVRALGMISDESSTLNLLDALTDKNKNVRSSAAWSLGLIGDDRAIGDLKDKVLHDESDEVKENSIWALGSIGEKKVADFLMKIILNNDDFKIRKKASRSLSELLDGPIPAKFKEKLDDGLVKTKMRVLEFLGFLGGEESSDYLKSYIHDSNPELRLTAIKSLEKLGSTIALKPLTNIVKNDNNLSIRETALNSLGKLNDKMSKIALKQLKKELEDEKLKGLIDDILENETPSSF